MYKYFILQTCNFYEKSKREKHPILKKKKNFRIAVQNIQRTGSLNKDNLYAYSEKL